jgi:Adenylate and Guanylate cyclase catalytic domain
LAQRKVTASILFSDVQGYSKLLNDADKVELLRIIREDVERRILTPDNHFHSNTWGDGYVIGCHDPQDAAEIALKMRDAVRTRDWKRERFQHEFALRVGLHMQAIQLVTETDGSEDIVGTGVDTAARIEPIAEANTVYCSEFFYLALMQHNPSKIKGIPVGIKRLAKNYGEMNLYQLLWEHEAVPSQSVPAPLSIPMPTGTRPITDKQRAGFVRDAYDQIKVYFTEALKALEAHAPCTETSIRTPTSEKFVCEVYVNGRSRSRCKIWLADGFMAKNGIGFADGNFDINSDTSYNDIISVEADGDMLYLKTLLGLAFTYSQGPLKGNPEQIAEALWKRFIRVLDERP